MDDRLGRKTVAELRTLARSRGLTGYGRLRKAELIAALVAGGEAPATSAATGESPSRHRASPSRVVAPKSATSAAVASPAATAGPEERAAPELEEADVTDAPRDPPSSRASAPAAPEGALAAESEGEERLVLLARDPHWLFCYWELLPGSLNRARGESTPPVPVLRVRHAPIGSEASSFYDERIDLASERHYLRVPQPEHRYRVELGLLAADGRFLALLASNEVVTPPAGAADEIYDLFVDGPEAAAAAFAENGERFLAADSGAGPASASSAPPGSSDLLAEPVTSPGGRGAV